MDYWQYLEQRRLLRLLGHVQLKRISTLLVDSFCPVGFPKKEWSGLERTVVEKIALVAAAHKAPDALNSCMLALIQRNDPDAVLRLYEQFMQLVTKSEGTEDVSGDGLEEGEGSTEYDALASATYSSVDTMPYKPGRATVLLSGITACAMKDDFLGALHMCLNTVIRPQHYAITTFMNKLKGNRPLQRKVEEYVSLLRSATMVAHPTELSKRVNQLATSRSIRSIEKLYQASWTCGRKDLAAQMWDDMIGLDVQPGVSTWTAYIDACDGISAYNEAVAGWGMMLEQGVKPEALSYRAIISTYFNARQTDKAMDTFRTFLEDAAKESPERQQLAVYNTVMHGLLIAGRVDEATATFQKMVDEGPRPDVVSYNTFLKFWARTSNFKMLSSVMNDMVAAGIKGDIFSFSTILSALLKVGRDDAPELMIALMRKQGVEPNVAIYSAIMDQQLREQTVEALHTAMRLLQRMELDPTSQPNEVTYTSFLAGIYRGSWLPPAVAEDWRRNIVDRMKRRGIKLNRVTYHILLKACLEYPEPEGVETAMIYYREMVKQKIHIISITWYILLSGLLRRGELGLRTRYWPTWPDLGFSQLALSPS
ncbi:pentatricopeptide repeat-containing protein [Salix suchowensis]|nr:pentatricopeptide repeat-containing protein [Salix suchowensis]